MHRPDPTRPRRPAFEGLEPRSLLSGLLPAIGPTASPGFEGITPTPNIPSSLRTAPTYALLQNYVRQIQASPPAGLGFATKNAAALDARPALTDPTPAEVAREYFTANFVGRYTVGAGRQVGQALTIHANNTFEAGSNQSLKGKAQLILFTPTSPAQAASPGGTVAVPGGQVTGLMSFFDQNFLQSGNLAIADVGTTNQSLGTAAVPANPATGAAAVAAMPASAPDLSGPTTLQDVKGLLLPTSMPWAFDATSAGAYTAPAGFTQGGGQIAIKYTPDAHPRAGTLGSGKIEVLLQGLMHTSTILNILDKGFN